LQQLSTFFGDKRYVGIEKKPESLLQARQNFTSANLTFREGDIETLHEDLKGQYDVVYIRMVLEYLKQPSLTLEHAHSYLRKGGHVIIIDAYDPAMRVSREVPIINETVRLHNEKNKAADKGNRKVTLEVLDELKNRTRGLSELYDVVSTNLDENGEILQELYRTQGPRDRKLSFTTSMLYLAIMNKGWGIPDDLSRGYDELHVSLEDENSWCAPGLHYIFLKKK
jgi:SAM-dependent methyltransferase